MLSIPVIVLFIVFLLIAIRQIGKIKLQIWQIMLFGAAIVLITRQISFYEAIKAINFDVILFLFGMFVIGQALDESGYLSHLTYNFFKNAKSTNRLIIYILFGFGFLSALLMNDTIAIIGVPVVIHLSKAHKISSKLLLLTLAFSVTIGSVMSPIGNPQNLLIAINGNIRNPFINFLKYLFIPTIINLFLTYLILKLLFKTNFKKGINHSKESIKDHKLAFYSKISLILVIICIVLRIFAVWLKLPFEFKLTYIALISMLPIVVLSSKRFSIIKKIDWYTLIFFAAMFILMQCVWNTNFFQNIIEKTDLNILNIPSIFLVSISFSQLLSNVPLVALYLPMLLHAGGGIKELIALAAASTIAGNLLILGAASNIIIIQNAEKKAKTTLSFFDFAKAGIPVTIVNVFIYWIFLSLF